MNAHLLLLIIAVICWFIASIYGFLRNAPSTLNLEALGLFFFGLSMLVH